MSKHTVDVIRIEEILPHPNADSLGIIKVHNYTCCVRRADWKVGDLAAYIPPDSIVPATEQFSFLGTARRIKVKRLRGVYSQGLLVPAPALADAGDDVMEAMNVTHYEPPAPPMSTRGEDAKAPGGWWPTYDVESWYKYEHLLVSGEPIAVTEKIHGCNARYMFDGEMHLGSRTRWKMPNGDHVWGRCLQQNPWIEQWCRTYRNAALYGEVYGQVQDLKYNVGVGEFRLAVFDIWEAGTWWTRARLIAYGPEHLVPVLYCGTYDKVTLAQLAEGKSLLADHVREGCVVQPLTERTCTEIGRVKLKLVGNGYLERA